MNAQDFRRETAAFQAYNESKDLSPRTITSYKQELRQFHRWLIAEHGEEAEITARRIREYMAHRFARGNKRLTVRASVMALRAFFGFLIRDGVLEPEENPMRGVEAPRGPQVGVTPLTGEETRRLLDSFDKDDQVEQRNFVMCLLILDTGLRVSEIARLGLDDIDFDRSSLKVNGKGRKPRTVYMGRKMSATLLNYVENRRPEIANGYGTLFPPTTRSTYATMRPHYLSEIIRNKMDEAGIPRANSSAHRLRHTFGYNFAKAGGSMFALQKLLGHSKLDMTRRYVMLADEDVREAHRKASPVDRMAL